jgi:hypothetical protein
MLKLLRAVGTWEAFAVPRNNWRTISLSRLERDRHSRLMQVVGRAGVSRFTRLAEREKK